MEQALTELPTIESGPIRRRRSGRWEDCVLILVIGLTLLATFRGCGGEFPWETEDYRRELSEAAARDFEQRRFERALQAIAVLSWVERTENLDIVYFNRGQIHFAAGQFAEAIQDYTLVLQHRPGHLIARRKRALAREKMGDFVGAVEDLYDLEAGERASGSDADSLEVFPQESYLAWMSTL